jgi:hypothetical protein
MFERLVVVLRFCVDPGIVRDSRETSCQALGESIPATGEEKEEEVRVGGGRTVSNYVYSHADVRPGGAADKLLDRYAFCIWCFAHYVRAENCGLFL